MQKYSETEIFEQLSKDDKFVFEGIFRSFYPELTFYALRFTEDNEISEEIVQDIFFNLWEKRKEISIKSSLKSYLYQSVKNSCLNYIKHDFVKLKYQNYYSEQIKIDELNSSDWITDKELSENIKSAVNKMPEIRKKVFVLNKINGLKYKEIAEDLGISIKTVEAHMGKALKFLREELKDLLPLLLFLLIE